MDEEDYQEEIFPEPENNQKVGEKNQSKPNDQSNTRIIKPHEKRAPDFSHLLLQNNEETMDQAPLVVVVQGSKNSGKSTLIRSLIKHYTRHKISNIKGTITIRSGKNQRVTFVECPNDINSMIDYAKIADLALLLVDGSLGFEMETFEFLSILKSHGFPNVMGVLTHLDFFKENKQLRKTKKKLKKRFMFECGEEYKLFYLSGIKNDMYPQMEILNLARFISIIKYKQIEWKLNHPFILIDRFENNEDGKQTEEDNCSVSFYGYVRGSSLRNNNKVHIMGLGDYQIDQISVVEDPCPPLLKKMVDIKEENENEEGNNEEIKKKPKKKRTLKQNERIIYAPHTNLGFLNYEKSGGYITIPEENVVYTKFEKPAKREDLLDNLEKDSQENLSEKPEEELEEGVKMVRDLQDIKKGINEKLLEDEQIELFDNFNLEIPKDEINIEDKSKIEFKERKTLLTTLKNTSSHAEHIMKEDHPFLELKENILCDDIQQVIYGKQDIKKMNEFDCSRYKNVNLLPRNKYVELNLKSFFVTGNPDQILDEEEQKEQFENEKKEKKQGKENKNEELANLKTYEKTINTDFENMLDPALGIYKRGTYIKINITNIKYKYYKNFSGENPLILCRINPAEDNFGFLKIRIKKHRWYGNILKSNDPVIFSIGWRRYQSIPIYCVQDPNDRFRYLKYTPQYDYCFAYFYGCFVPPLTGVLCTQTLSNKLVKYRIAAMGEVMELSHTASIMKKLKLIGEPFKIYKNSAFIKGMFNSMLEVAKFEGATLRTVSGIRGQIKKAITAGQEGSFRATFEDKILLSDLVFCRTWYSVCPEKFFNPIISFDKVRLMKNTWELRQINQIPIPKNQDSEYKDVQRQIKVFNPLKISKKLEENLPFKSKEKLKKVSLKEKLQKMEYMKPMKSLTSEHEQQVYSLIQRLNTIRNEKKKLKKEKQSENLRIQERVKEAQEKKFEDQRKDFEKEKSKKKYSKGGGKFSKH